MMTPDEQEEFQRSLAALCSDYGVTNIVAVIDIEFDKTAVLQLAMVTGDNPCRQSYNNIARALHEIINETNLYNGE